MFLRSRGADGPVSVPGVGRGNIDGLDARVGEEVVVAGVALAGGDWELLGERLGGLARATADRRQTSRFGRRHTLGESLGDVPGSEDSPRQLFCHNSLSTFKLEPEAYEK